MGRQESFLAVPATACWSVRHNWERNSLASSWAPCDEGESPDEASDLVVRGRVELPTFRFSGVFWPSRAVAGRRL